MADVHDHRPMDAQEWLSSRGRHDERRGDENTGHSPACAASDAAPHCPTRDWSDANEFEQPQPIVR